MRPPKTVLMFLQTHDSILEVPPKAVRLQPQLLLSVHLDSNHEKLECKKDKNNLHPERQATNGSCRERPQALRVCCVAMESCEVARHLERGRRCWSGVWEVVCEVCYGVEDKRAKALSEGALKTVRRLLRLITVLGRGLASVGQSSASVK
ncbi:hypothetical protein BKA81DRAFT_400891 [Phyllosticta paracitricarpa]